MSERPTRLVKQLKKLCKCLALIRGKERVTIDEIKTIRRVAEDTVPQDRLTILKMIEDVSKTNVNGCPRSKLLSCIPLPESSILKIIEQLKMLELIKVKLITEQDKYNETKTYFYENSKTIRDILGSPPTFTKPLSKNQEDTL